MVGCISDIIIIINDYPNEKWGRRHKFNHQQALMKSKNNLKKNKYMLFELVNSEDQNI